MIQQTSTMPVIETTPQCNYFSACCNQYCPWQETVQSRKKIKNIHNEQKSNSELTFPPLFTACLFFIAASFCCVATPPLPLRPTTVATFELALLLVELWCHNLELCEMVHCSVDQGLRGHCGSFEVMYRSSLSPYLRQFVFQAKTDHILL